MFKKFLIPAMALAAASVAVPAAAQSYGYVQIQSYGPGYGYGHGRYEQNHRGWQSIATRKYQMDNRIDVGLRNGALSWREASSLRGRLNALVRLEHQMMYGGLSWSERQRLDREYDQLARQIRYERRDRDNRRW